MTTTETETDEWQFPIDDIVEHHKNRIPGHEDHVPATVEAWVKDEGLIWSAMINDTGKASPRDCGLHAARIMAVLTACDYLVFTFDTHMTTHQTNPTTGKPWKPGEMQRMCDEEGYCDTGNIRDNLVVAAVRRSDAKIYFASIPYHFHKGEVMYFEPTPPISEWDGSEAKMMGVIPDGLREAIKEQPIEERLDSLGIKEGLGFDPNSEEDRRLARLHQILAGVRVLGQAGQNSGATNPMFFHMIATNSDAEREAVQETAKRGAITVETLPREATDAEEEG